MKNSELMKRMSKWLIIPVLMAFVLNSCKEEEEDFLTTFNKNRGTFSATINGESWSAEEVWVAWAYEGQEINIEGSAKNGQEIDIYLDPNLEEKKYVFEESLKGMIWFNDEKNEVEPPYWSDGYFDLVKYTSDTLVANFNIKVNDVTIENGVIAVSLRNKFGEPAN